MERHYGMDWLRIGAFALLILYHVGMVFAPWPYHLKTAHPMDWVAVPMLATNAWRLALLFVVSGFASRALLAKSGGVLSFLRGRSARLLVPLGVGMIVIVPAQCWVELVTQHGYAANYLTFLGSDYFRFGSLYGLVMPTWDHLWFVVYLWVYTVVLALLAIWTPAKLQSGFDAVFAGWRALVVPVAYLVLFQVMIFQRGIETHDLFHDGVAHLAYLPAFLFGFGLARSPTTLDALARHWKLSSVLALLGYAVVAAIEIRWPGNTVPPEPFVSAFRVAREVQTWSAIAALIGVAHRYLNRDHAWRAMLTEAVFPFYIIHQTIIVVVGYWLVTARIGPLAEFLILVPATAAGCWLFYASGHRFTPIRPLIGLRAAPKRRLEAGSRTGVSASFEHSTT